MKNIFQSLGLSKLTDRYQTTIPTFVRKELGLGKKDFIEFLKSEDGHLVLRKAQPQQVEEEFSPTLLAWLDFIAKDHEQRPEQLTPITQEMVDRWKKLTKDVEVDIDAALDDEEL